MPLKSSISKFGSADNNEDALFCHENIYAIADGAGGSGIACGEWASYLVENAPKTPIYGFEEFVTWLEPLAEIFANKYESIFATDPYKVRRFYEEGSACTLVILWDMVTEMHWLTFGDSHVFYCENAVLESHPFQTRDALSGSTHLLNWRQLPNVNGFKTGKFQKTSTSQYLLATDEISKHIFYLHEQFYGNFGSKLKELTDSLVSEDNFWKYIKSQKDIGEDDYTLINIQN